MKRGGKVWPHTPMPLTELISEHLPHKKPVFASLFLVSMILRYIWSPKPETQDVQYKNSLFSSSFFCTIYEYLMPHLLQPVTITVLENVLSPGEERAGLVFTRLQSSFPLLCPLTVAGILSGKYRCHPCFVASHCLQGKAFYDVGSPAPSSDVSCPLFCPVVQESAKYVQWARKSVLPFIFVQFMNMVLIFLSDWTKREKTIFCDMKIMKLKPFVHKYSFL